MCTNIEGYDLNGRFRHLFDLQNFFELGSHDSRSADRTPQYCLIKKYSVTRLTIFLEELLATKPCFYMLLVYIRTRFGEYCLH